MNYAPIILAAILGIYFTANPAIQAAPPRLLPFQGRLTDASGVPVADGAKVVQFKISDAPTGGTAVWNGEVQKVTVNGGLVSTLLGRKADLSPWTSTRRSTSKSPCGNAGQSANLGAPVKRASTRVKVPSVQLDGSAPQTVPTASPRGGVGSRHGVEPAGRNEHMNHTHEPRKFTPGSRAPQDWAKAAEPRPGPTVVGLGNGPAGSAWATCREVTLG